MNDRLEFIEYFLEFSVILTGYSRFHLQGTDQVSSYFDTVRNVVGDDLFAELLNTFHGLDLKAKSEGDESILTNGLRLDILGSEKLGPIARNIIKLWYVATWYPLPKAWRDNFGTKEKDGTFVVSPQAYPEGLLWPTLGVNPPAAKAPGYATWSDPPKVSLNS